MTRNATPMASTSTFAKTAKAARTTFVLPQSKNMAVSAGATVGTTLARGDWLAEVGRMPSRLSAQNRSTAALSAMTNLMDRTNDDALWVMSALTLELSGRCRNT